MFHVILVLGSGPSMVFERIVYYTAESIEDVWRKARENAGRWRIKAIHIYLDKETLCEEHPVEACIKNATGTRVVRV